MVLINQFDVCLYDKYNIIQLSQDCGTKKYWKIDQILLKELSSCITYFNNNDGKGRKLPEIKIINEKVPKSNIISSNKRYIPLLFQICIPLFHDTLYGNSIQNIVDTLNYLGFNIFNYDKYLWDTETFAFKQLMIEMTDSKVPTQNGTRPRFLYIKLMPRSREKAKFIMAKCHLT